MDTREIKPSRRLGSFSWRESAVVCSVMLLGMVARLGALNFQPLWWDEGYSLFFATRDLATLLERTAVDIHPPLYYVVLQAWMFFAGKTDVAVRLMSVAIGVATIPLLFAFARRLFGFPLAFLSALLLALSPLHIYYSQEVRMYGLVTLLCLASVHLFWSLLNVGSPALRPATPAASAATSVGFVLVTAAALYTQYYAAFIIAFEILLLVALAARARRWAAQYSRLIGLIVASFLLYLPWVLYAGPKLYAYVTFKVGHEAYPPLDPLTYLAQHLAAFSVGHLGAWTWLYGASWLTILLAALAAYRWLRERNEFGQTASHPPPASDRFGVLLYLLVPLVLGYLVNLVYPFHPIRTERLILFALPAFLMLVAAGIQVMWQKSAPLALFSVLVVSIISATSLYDFYLVPRYPNDDYRPLFKELQAFAQPGDLFLGIYPWQIGYLQAYYRGAPLEIREVGEEAWSRDPSRIENELAPLLKQHPRVWLPALQTLGRILEDALEAYLRPRAYSIVDKWFGTSRLELYALAPDPVLTGQSIVIRQGIVLSDWGISPQPVSAGRDTLYIRLDWPDSTPPGWHASLRLKDPRGSLWAQADRGIEKGTARVGLAIPTGTPPGLYSLTLAVYRSDSGEPAGQDAHPLAQVAIIAPTVPNTAAIQYRTLADFEHGIRLIGYDRGDGNLTPGEAAGITLYWQSSGKLEDDYAVVLQVEDDRGNIFAQSQAAPALGVYPTSAWQPGELVRDPQTIVLRGDAPDGTLRLAAGLIDPKTGASIKTTSGQARAPLGNVPVQGRRHYYGAPAVSHPMDVRFGEVARLVGYDLRAEQGSVHLVLYWQALGSTTDSFKVFAHVLDDKGQMRAQKDQIPGAGAFPTTGWVKGEYLVDEYAIPIPGDANPRDLTLAVGLYNRDTGVRLPAQGTDQGPIGDHVVLPFE